MSYSTNATPVQHNLTPYDEDMSPMRANQRINSMVSETDAKKYVLRLCCDIFLVENFQFKQFGS